MDAVPHAKFEMITLRSQDKLRIDEVGFRIDFVAYRAMPNLVVGA